MFRTTLTGMAALALGTAATVALPMEAQAQRRMMGNAADRQYVAAAGAGDQYEIQSSQLALERTQNPVIREFAQMMISDHNRTTADVTAAAQRDGLRPMPPMMNAMQRQMVRQLRNARGRQFDTLYISQQRTAHQQALALHRSRSMSRRASALSQTAATAVPIVQGHIEHLRHLANGTMRPGMGHRM